jgi:hypothetical protein
MSDATQPALPHSLTERVQTRVTEARLALGRRHTARQREARSLRRVFLELGDVHRQYRQRTGQHGSPALREAANAFKQAPSLTSLTAVAAFLDEDGILEW